MKNATAVVDRSPAAKASPAVVMIGAAPKPLTFSVGATGGCEVVLANAGKTCTHNPGT